MSDAHRFRAFVERKEREAMTATLWPYTTTIDAPTRGLIAVGNAWTRGMFDGAFYLSPAGAAVPATSLVFVQSKDGNTGARNPASLGGGATDQHLVYEGLSRVAADAVLTGAETVRGSQLIFSVWHPELVALRAALGLRRHPVQIVGTLRGLGLRESLIFNVPEVRVVVLTLGAGVERMRPDLETRPWITTVVMAGPHDLRTAFAALRGMGIARVSAIGGRTLARALIEAGLIDELYLTTSSRPGGEPKTPFYHEALSTQTIVRKHGSGVERAVLFEHRLLGRAPHGAA